MKTMLKSTGAFEAHEDLQMVELYSLLQPYYQRHSTQKFKSRLFNAILDYLEDNEDGDMWFQNQFYNYTNPDDAMAFVNLLCNLIERMFKDNRLILDKEVFMAWDGGKTFRTENGILVRYTKNYIALKTITPTGIMMSLEEYKIVCNELKLNLDTLTSPNLLQFITHYENDKKHDFWKRFKSFIVFEESYLVELGLKSTTPYHATTSYEIGKGYERKNEKFVSNMETTIDVFDGF